MSGSESHISLTNVTAPEASPKRPRKLSKAVLEEIWRQPEYRSVWARDCLGFRADEYQRLLLDSDAPSIAVLWSRQLGKTQVCALIAAHTARWIPRSITLIASASMRQASVAQRRVLSALEDISAGRHWESLGEVDVLEDQLDPDSHIIKASVLALELANKSTVISIPAQPDAARGYSPNLIIMDEAARIGDATFDAIGPMRAVTRARLIVASTPAGRRGRFFEIWSGDDPSWTRLRATADDCGRIDRAFLDRERANMSSESAFRAEYYCSFEALQGGVFTAEDLASIGAGKGAWKMPATAPRKDWEGDLVVPQKGWSL